MGVLPGAGIGGLAPEQNDWEEEGVVLHAPLDVETSLQDGADVVRSIKAGSSLTGSKGFFLSDLLPDRDHLRVRLFTGGIYHSQGQRLFFRASSD